MSKQDSPPPPSYNDSISSPFPSSSSSHPNLTTSLTTLSTLLRQTQAHQSALASRTTSTLLPLLTPPLAALLARLGTTPHPPLLAELVLVPAAAVAPSWTIASEAGEVVEVVRVSGPDSKTYGEEKSTPVEGASSSSASRGFDDWGRWEDSSPSTSSTSSSGTKDSWWWDDEGLARRLARELQPEPKMDRTVVRAAVERAREEKKAGGGRWGLFRGAASPAEASSSSSSSSAPPPRSGKSMTQGQDEDVSMSVRAEEVTFRRENEMGIWESTRGWGIVARVRIRR